MADQNKKLVYISGQGIAAFPSEMSDDKILSVIRKHRKSQSLTTEKSEHERQLKPAQPLSTAIPKLPDWATTPLLNEQNLQESPEAQARTAKSQAEFSAAHPKIAASLAKGDNPVVLGVGKGVENFTLGMTSPVNVGLMAAAPESKLLSALFSVQALRGTYKSAEQARQAYKAGHNQEAIQYATEAILGAGMGAMAGAHAYSGLPEGVRSALASEEGSVGPQGNTPKPTSAYKSVDDSKPFYLKSEHIIGDKMRGPMPAADLHKMLLSNGVKPEEMKWTGLEDLLLGKGNQKVTPAEIQEHLAGNNLQLQEVVKGSAGPKPTDAQKAALRQWVTTVPDLNPRERTLVEEDLRSILQRNDPEAIGNMEMLGAPHELTAPFAAHAGGEVGPKFGSYVLPGGESYREMLVTMPPKQGGPVQFELDSEVGGQPRYRVETNNGLAFVYFDKPSDSWAYYADKGQTFRHGLKSADEAKAEVSHLYRAPTPHTDKFQSSHWDEPNVLGHVRFNDRTGPNGERILHLEELQSDLHQAGRTQGYRLSSRETAPMDSEYRALVHKNADARTRGEEPKPEDVSRAKELEDALIKADKSKIPDMPFKKNWHELLLKRMMKYAADNGYDGVSWTPGEEQAERYDLSKQISRVEYDPHEEYLFAWDNNGRKVLDESNVEPKDIPNWIGKEAAEKFAPKINEWENDASSGLSIAKQENEEGRYYLVDGNGEPFYNNSGYVETYPTEKAAETNRKFYDEQQRRQTPIPKLEGLDLKVGGEGMRGFYDKIIPDAANKLGKQWGARVGETKVVTETKPKKTYVGPSYTAEQLKKIADEVKGTMIEGSAKWVADSVRQGSSLEEAMDAYGSPMLAEKLGGSMDVISKKETKTVPYLPLTPAARTGIKNIPFSLFTIPLAAGALTLDQVKKKANELRHPVTTVSHEDGAAQIPPEVKYIQHALDAKVVAGKPYHSAISTVGDHEPNTIEVNDLEKFKQGPKQTISHEVTHLWQNSLPPKIQEKIPPDDPNHPYVLNLDHLDQLRRQGVTLAQLPREMAATIVQRFSASPADRARLQPWLSDMANTPLSVMMPTRPQDKEINRNVRPPTVPFESSQDIAQAKQPDGRPTSGRVDNKLPPQPKEALNQYANPEDQPPKISFEFNKKWSKPGPYAAKLSPQEETEFRKWAAANPQSVRGEIGPAPNFDPIPTADYDVRAHFHAAKAGDPAATLVPNKWDGKIHGNDKFKTPYNGGFSNESMYALPNAPRWVGNRLMTVDGKLVTDETPRKPASKPTEPPHPLGKAFGLDFPTVKKKAEALKKQTQSKKQVMIQ